MKFVFNVIGLYLRILNSITPRFGGMHTFYIFCSPFSAKITAKQQSFLDTANQKNIIVNGEKIRLYKWGNGDQNILCVHGWRSNTYRWRDYVNSLVDKGCTVYSLDFPAHGNSEGKFWNILKGESTIKAAVEQIGKVDTIISHSVGSFCSLYFCDQNPTLQPRQIVSLASAGKIHDFINEVKRMLSLTDREIDNLKDYFISFSGKDPDYFDIENFFTDIKSKALLVHDVDDPDTNVNYSHRLHDLFDDSQLLITKGLGHKLRSKDVLQRVVQYVTT
jgi:pimeloyl-ACP methyl ester carboxylesterase